MLLPIIGYWKARVFIDLKYHYLRNTFREADLSKNTHAHTDSMVTSSTYTFA